MRKFPNIIVLSALTLGISLPVAAQQACLRLTHLSPDAPAVDVLINGVESFSDLNFADYSSYLNLEPGSYVIEVTPANDPDTILLGKAMRLAADRSYTTAVVGTESELEFLYFKDMTTPLPPGWAASRILNLAPDSPMVDLVAPDGRVILEDMMGGMITEYALIPAGSYPVTIQDQDGNEMATELFVLNDGEVTTGIGAGLVYGNSPSVQPVVAVDFPNDCSLNYQSVDYTGMWYDPTQNGHGVQLVRTGDLLEGAWYSYDGAGASTFYTFYGELDADGNLSTDLIAWTGPAQGADWDEAQVNGTVVGDVSVVFGDTTLQAAMSWSVGGGASGSMNLLPYRYKLRQ